MSDDERRPRAYSVCAAGHEAEPLVSSLEVRMTEWLCMRCGARYPMFGPASRSATDALYERWIELCRLYRSGVRMIEPE